MNPVICFFLVVALSFGGSPALGAVGLADTLFIGTEALQRGRYAQAVQALSDALAQDPNNAYAQGRLALALAASGQTDKARRTLEKSLAAHNDDLFALWTLGCIDLLAGQPAAAGERFAAINRADSGNIRGMVGQGLAAIAQGHTAQGLDFLAKAQASDSQDALSRFLLGLAYWMLDAPANARLELEATLELEPRNLAALELLGLVYQRQGKANLAKSAWEQALAIDPDQRGARFFLSRLDEDAGLAATLAERPEEAKRAYARALAIDPGNGAAAKALGVPTIDLRREPQAPSSRPTAGVRDGAVRHTGKMADALVEDQAEYQVETGQEKKTKKPAAASSGEKERAHKKKKEAAKDHPTKDKSASSDRSEDAAETAAPSESAKTTDRPDAAEKPEPAAKPTSAAKTEDAVKTDKAAKTDKTEKAEKTNKADKAGKKKSAASEDGAATVPPAAATSEGSGQ